MQGSNDGGRPINGYALVAYIPDPLRLFLDELRRELVPGCSSQAHVTILPPRTLEVSVAEAWEEICARVSDFPAFQVEPTQVEVFDETSVVYLAVGNGWPELVRLHNHLNTGALRSLELFPYHPHITLAQEFEYGQLERIYELARRRWAEFPHKRPFPVENLSLVENTTRSLWVDVARCPLAKQEATA